MEFVLNVPIIEVIHQIVLALMDILRILINLVRFAPRYVKDAQMLLLVLPVQVIEPPPQVAVVAMMAFLMIKLMFNAKHAIILAKNVLIQRINAQNVVIKGV